jgi:purine-binding chemotaxis protein CheW
MTSDSTTAPEPAANRLLIIELHGGLYGVDADAVREIVGFPAATRLPGAPPHVRGVVNLRGQLLTVVDIGHRLTGTPATVGSEGSIVVITSNDRVLGLLVEDVHDVQEVLVAAADREMLAHADGLLTGVGRLGDEVVLVVDIPELVRQTLA